MAFFHALILGIVEGLTEYLPISSTAHLIITSSFLKIPQSDFQKFFEVFIQSGAVLAVVVLYFRYVLKNRQIIGQLTISFIPTAIVGLLLYKVIKNVFFNSVILVISTLGIVGLGFIVVEWLIKKNKIRLTKNINQLNAVEATLIGLVQSLAVIPGVSRSGIVTVGMMIMGYERDEAARYSFLLAAPTILGASVYDLFKTRSILMSTNQYLPLFVGFITSFLVAYLVMKWFVMFLQKNTLIPFGIYRIGLAIILLFLPKL